MICVVEEPKDVAAIEKIREFAVATMSSAARSARWTGSAQESRPGNSGQARGGGITEVILATDPNLEGEATATYLARLVKPLGLRVTRRPAGSGRGDLEYADEVTLGRAFEGRRLLDV